MLCIAYLHTYIRSIRISYFLPFFVNLHVPIFMYFICVLNCFTVYGFFIFSLLSLSLSISLPLGFRIENSQHMKLYAIKLFNSNLTYEIAFYHQNICAECIHIFANSKAQQNKSSSSRICSVEQTSIHNIALNLSVESVWWYV